MAPTNTTTIAVHLVAALLTAGCTTTFRGYSDVNPPYADPELVGQSWSNGEYDRTGAQLGKDEQFSARSLASLSKDNSFAFFAKADLGQQIGNNIRASLNAGYSGVSKVEITDTRVVGPNDVRRLTYANGNAIVTKVIYAEAFRTTFDQNLNLDASAKASFQSAAAVINNGDPASINVTFNDQNKTALVAAPNTAIAARVLRFKLSGNQPDFQESTAGSQSIGVGDYQVSFYPLAANQAASTNLTSANERFCIGLDVSTRQVVGQNTGTQFSAYCPQPDQVEGMANDGYFPVNNYAYRAMTPPIYGTMVDDELRFLQADLSGLKFHYISGTDGKPYLTKVSGTMKARESRFAGSVVVAK